MTNSKAEQNDVTTAAAAVDELLEDSAGFDPSVALPTQDPVPFCNTSDIKIATIGNVDSGKS